MSGRVQQEKNAELVRVTLDNGVSVTCTPDHKWMLRDGEWCEASLLKPETSLMPLYRKTESFHGKSAYEKVYDPSDNRWKWTHSLVASFNMHQDASTIAKSQRPVVHHIDFNRFNNAPNNLREMSWGDHHALHIAALDSVRKKALAEGKYHGLNNGNAKKCRKNVEHLWDINKLAQWCLDNKVTAKCFIFKNYGLQETQFNRLLKENNLTYKEFASLYIHGGYKLCRKDVKGAKLPGKFGLSNDVNTILNHKVVSVEILEERRDTWCIEVEGIHNFAIEKSVIISNSKATLSQEDIRFSRSINKIQQVLISELQKIAIIHLFTHGYEGEDLTDFTLYLSNPSTVAQQQKLELWRQKFEIAGSVPEGLTDRDFLRKEIFQLTDDSIEEIRAGRRRDKLEDLALESVELEGNEPGSSPGGGGGSGGGLGGLAGLDDLGGLDDEGAPEAGGESPESSGGEDSDTDAGSNSSSGGDEDLFAGDVQTGEKLLIGDSDNEDEIEDEIPEGDSLSAALDTLSSRNKNTDKNKGIPIKSSPLAKYQYDRSRLRTHGARKTHMPDFKNITSFDSDPFDKRFFNASPFSEAANKLLNDAELYGAVKKGHISNEMKATLESLRSSIRSVKKHDDKAPSVLLENNQVELDDELFEIKNNVGLDDET